MKNKGFILQLRIKAEQTAQEYTELLHEHHRLEMRIERTKSYIEDINSFLKAEEQNEEQRSQIRQATDEESA